MNPLNYYEEAIVKTDHNNGDFIKIDYRDGARIEGMVAGVVLTGNFVHVFLTKGPRLALSFADRISIVSRGGPK